MMRYFIYGLCLFLYGGQCLNAQNIPRREFRAVWIATVGNIDWPSKQGLDAATQQTEFRQILDRCQQNGLNAVIVQIRPAADALYASPFENWSRYLSGKQGQPPLPYYDPLQFMVEETHKRCMEFHAWFNPYRALVDAKKNLHTRNHVTRSHPQWFLSYGGKLYFDPGLPEVRAYFTKIVLDVVKRYDIDAVHFDDYFYPYRIAGQEFPDFKTFSLYGSGFGNRDDWRRQNVNILIESLSKAIKAEKKHVKFGISPFGVWRNASKDPEGSHTRGGQTNYDDLFADVLLWLRKGWIDYILPQLYWELGHKAADYAELLQWWSRHTYGRHLYIGHGLYQVGVSPKACWRSMNEIEHQVERARKTEKVQGSSYYSANAFKVNRCNLNASFEDQINPYKALLPLMPWLDDQAPTAPEVSMLVGPDGSVRLQWQVKNPDKENLQFAIYRFDKEATTIYPEARHLVAIIREREYMISMADYNRYRYRVSCLDRFHNESALVEAKP